MARWSPASDFGARAVSARRRPARLSRNWRPPASGSRAKPVRSDTQGARASRPVAATGGRDDAVDRDEGRYALAKQPGRATPIPPTARTDGILPREESRGAG